MAKKVQRGLGRGLGALLGDAVEQEESRPQPQEREADEVRMLPVRLIDPNREQPRRSFDEQALEIWRSPSARWACCSRSSSRPTATALRSSPASGATAPPGWRSWRRFRPSSAIGTSRRASRPR